MLRYGPVQSESVIRIASALALLCRSVTSVVLPTYWRKRCQACFSWQKDGTCKFGDACKYSQYVCMEGGGAHLCVGLCLGCACACMWAKVPTWK